MTFIYMVYMLYVYGVFFSFLLVRFAAGPAA